MRCSIVLILMTLIGVHYPAFANQTFDYPPVVVTWADTDNYRDIEAANENQSRFEQQVFKHLSQFFAKEAKKHLAAGQTLHIEVTDLDLAGDVRYRPKLNRDMRVLDDLTPAKLNFNYQILSDDKVLKQGTEKLSELNYLSSVHGPARDRPFAYEYQLIKKWANKSL